MPFQLGEPVIVIDGQYRGHRGTIAEVQVDADGSCWVVVALGFGRERLRASVLKRDRGRL